MATFPVSFRNIYIIEISRADSENFCSTAACTNDITYATYCMLYLKHGIQIAWSNKVIDSKLLIGMGSDIEHGFVV